MAVKIKCYECEEINAPTPPLRRDSDRVDIFECPSCQSEFKIDMHHYFANRSKKGFVAKTFSSSLDTTKDYDNELQNLQKKILKELEEKETKEKETKEKENQELEEEPKINEEGTSKHPQMSQGATQWLFFILFVLILIGIFFDS